MAFDMKKDYYTLYDPKDGEPIYLPKSVDLSYYMMKGLLPKKPIMKKPIIVEPVMEKVIIEKPTEKKAVIKRTRKPKQSRT